ncbi:hypothetical protein ADEAN_000919600 [Angomonas deanei]|uniref:Uncharacterized protein n=1 Tax=Angomonas deanei TaxID=59799 RepID=A0A7G2CRQ5_9TRYP|nr:hypothetical protein ADEAN_000919600 [Angomonas deanei]
MPPKSSSPFSSLYRRYQSHPKGKEIAIFLKFSGLAFVLGIPFYIVVGAKYMDRQGKRIDDKRKNINRLSNYFYQLESECNARGIELEIFQKGEDGYFMQKLEKELYEAGQAGEAKGFKSYKVY